MPELPLVRDPEKRLSRLAALWEASHLLAVEDTPRGVQKFRSMEEADAARRAVTAERMRRRRRAGPMAGQPTAFEDVDSDAGK